MIRFLVQTPKELLQDRVVPLLEVCDVVRFDSALLNHGFRRQLHNQLHGARLSTQEIKMDNEAAQWLLDRNIWATSLNVNGNVKDLKILKQLAGSVENISVENCYDIHPNSLVDFMQSCSKVKILQVNQSVDDRVVYTIARNCSELQKFSLSGNRNLRLDDLASLAVGCKRLTDIDLVSCVRCVDDEFIADLAASCPQLQRLCVDNCSACGDQSIEVLAEHCSDLRYLSICKLNKLTDKGLSNLSACSELRGLFIAGTNISASCIASVTHSCTKLEEISLPNLGGDLNLAVEALVRYCPALSYLHCSSKTFNDKSMSYLQHAAHLTKLVLFHAKISVNSLVLLLNHCVSVQHLELKHCTLGCTAAAVTPSAQPTAIYNSMRVCIIQLCVSPSKNNLLIALITQCPNLEELFLEGCPTFQTDASIMSVASHCCGLQSLNISFLPISDTAVIALAKECPNLRHLHMAHNCALTDVGVVEVLQKCRLLRELNLSCCSNITDIVLDAALVYGTNLRKVNVIRCTISRETIDKFKLAKPKCTFCR